MWIFDLRFSKTDETILFILKNVRLELIEAGMVSLGNPPSASSRRAKIRQVFLPVYFSGVTTLFLK